MRCKNCGWPNKPGAIECIKCKSKLSDAEGTQLEDYSGAATYNEPQPRSDYAESSTVMDAPDDGRQPTVAEGLGEIPSSPASRPEPRYPEECPSCHYPLRPNTQRCPNCQSVIWPVGYEEPQSQAQSQPCQQSAMQSSAYGGAAEPSPFSTVMANPHDLQKPQPAQNESEFSGTVNPYIQPKKKAEFRLELVPGQGERLEERERQFKGEEVTLNRSNTEAGNNTITSKVQAIVKFDGDSWTIEDHSSLRTTYVRAARPIELRDGDIILLGDRQFVFHVDQ